MNITLLTESKEFRYNKICCDCDRQYEHLNQEMFILNNQVLYLNN